METENDTDNDKIISNWLLNENTLLMISKEENEEYPIVSIRYEKFGEVHQKDLAILTPDSKVEYNEKMIAIFKRKNKVVSKFKLISVYDTISQEYIGTSDMYLHYMTCKCDGTTQKTLGTKKK